MYEELIGAGMQEKPDLIYLLTFMDLEMLKIAAEAASHYDVPLLCSMSFMGANKSGKRAKVSHTMMGNTCKDIVEGSSLQPHGGRPQLFARPRRRAARHIGVQGRHRLPIIFKPNAGAPIVGDNGEVNAAFDIEAFADDVLPAVDMGATYIGGCCGANAAYIKRLAEKIKAKLAAEENA